MLKKDDEDEDEDEDKMDENDVSSGIGDTTNLTKNLVIQQTSEKLVKFKESVDEEELI